MPDLLVELRDRVLYLTLNRPDKLNAMSPDMMNGLTAELQKSSHDPKVGAVVLTGAGRGFCSGGDITAMRARNEATGPAPTLEDRACCMRCRRSPSRRSTDRRRARD
jgi:enoyl-CoA hydratase/carnithine racemase